MRLSLFPRTEQAGFVVVDSLFPQKEPFAFRNSEINEYLKRIKNFKSYTMYPMKPDDEAAFGHGYGVSYREFLDNKKGYLNHYPGNGDRIKHLNPRKKYSFKLAYSFFLAETYVLLPFYEKHNIPFVFVLYPGGMFGLDSPESDRMLSKIFKSIYFRGVIVTQELTRRYLLDNNLCPEDKINYIYGGFVQFHEKDVKTKRLFRNDKDTLDICFVAAKYSERGVDKGYDLFIEVAKLLCKQTDDIMFHVVGGFNENDIDTSEIKSRIKFYGYKKPSFLLDFYAGMDIFLSPNRPFKLFGGNFDGFPLGIDSSFCGVALFVADELKMNHHYEKDKEVVIIPLDAAKITERILHYHDNQDDLYKLSSAGQLATQKLFDINYQVDKRISVFKKFAELEVDG